MVEREDPPPASFPPRVVEMPALVRAKDWSLTPLGAEASWSPSLKLALDMVLASGFPMALRWGPDFLLIYNDGYKPILADKHPWALGLPMREAWSEVWPQIEQVHEAIRTGRSEAIFAEDTVMRIQRRDGAWEDASFTLSYSPVPYPTAPGGIGGVLVTAVETTVRVETERRLREAEGALQALNGALEQQVETRTLRLKVPGLKILYTTGYTRNAVVHNGVLDPGVAFLPKPFSVADLALKLRAVLDA